MLDVLKNRAEFFIEQEKDNISPETWRVIRGRVISKINNSVDVPFLPESLEAVLIGVAVDFIVAQLGIIEPPKSEETVNELFDGGTDDLD